MYKKATSLLVLSSCLLMAVFLCATKWDVESMEEKPAKTLVLGVTEMDAKDKQRNLLVMETLKSVEKGSSRGLGIVAGAVSDRRVVSYSVLQNEYLYSLTEEELEILCKIVEAEAGCEDENGKLLVANVILNRMNSGIFPETVKDVVFQRENGVNQFSPIADGRYYKVVVSEDTKMAVERALKGEDISDGALYFVARKYADSDNVKWFDENLTYLFTHGGHEFFK